jgi:predicted Zn-dependent peptidase
MNRLGSEVLAGVPLLSIDETIERIDAVTVDDLGALVTEFWAPERLAAAGIGPDESQFVDALGTLTPPAPLAGAPA